MADGIDKPEEISENNLRIITFNYDRSFEEFFIGSLMFSYGIERRDAIELFRSTVDITHAYGKLGSIYGGSKRDYNDSLSHKPLTTAIEGIELIYEVKSSQKKNRLVDYIEKSDRIIFMGFGYHEENLDILGLNEFDISHKSFYGTAKGMRKFQKGRVNNLFDRFNSDIRLGHPNHGCWNYLERAESML